MPWRRERKTDYGGRLNRFSEDEAREHERKTVNNAVDEFLKDYKATHPRSATFADYGFRAVKRLLGGVLVVEVTDTVVTRYQAGRRTEGASPKTINDEVALLLRACGDHGDVVRLRLKRKKALKLKTPASPGRAFSADQKWALLEQARKLRSPNIYPALLLDLNSGLRGKELRELRWAQIDLLDKKCLTVGVSKTDAGTGRVIPLNEDVCAALEAHAAWFVRKFGACQPDWYVFPFGKPQPTDPTRPVTTLKTAWTKVRSEAGVKGRWHDNRHTLVTELAENGASLETIKSIVGHVSHQMVERYSHIRMEAKRKALDQIAANQRSADRKRKEEAGRQQRAADDGHGGQIAPQ
jgi:integrase